MKDLVIFCSGWGSPNGIEWKLSPIYQKLRECGMETKIWRNCNAGLVDIEHNADCLIEYIIDKQFKFDKRPDHIFLIGHSLGGLVAKYTAKYVGVDGVITIGTPHLGVHTARLMAPWSKSASQMVPGSELLNNLNSDRVTNLYSIACKYDGIVRPIKNSISPMSSKQDVVRCSHLTVLFSREVANKISDFIWGGIK